MFMLFLNLRLGYITDDWHFKFTFTGFWPDEDSVRVHTLKDIAASVKGYYNISGGRVFAHALVYLSLMFNEHIFDFLNATAFISLGILILKCAVPGKVIKPQMLALTYLMMILFLPAFGDTCLWVSGSINYLWMAIISAWPKPSTRRKPWSASPARCC